MNMRIYHNKSLISPFDINLISRYDNKHANQALQSQGLINEDGGMDI